MVINRRIKCYLNTNYVKTYKHKSIIYSAILKYGLSVFRLDIFEHCSKEEVTPERTGLFRYFKPNPQYT